jgi:hypothetical protein
VRYRTTEIRKDLTGSGIAKIFNGCWANECRRCLRRCDACDPGSLRGQSWRRLDRTLQRGGCQLSRRSYAQDERAVRYLLQPNDLLSLEINFKAFTQVLPTDVRASDCLQCGVIGCNIQRQLTLIFSLNSRQLALDRRRPRRAARPQ